MKIVFLVPYPVGKSPSQRFRFEQYFELLQQHGYQIEIQSFWDEASWAILYQPGKFMAKMAGLFRGFLRRCRTPWTTAQADYVFIHRELTPIGPPVFEWMLQRLKRKIIYDFDDAIWIPATSTANRLATWLKFTAKVGYLCRVSFRVSCGNEYLADYARQFNPNVVVNPTTLDTLNWHNPDLVQAPTWKDPQRITLGWTGTHSTLPYLEPLVPVFDQLSKEYPRLEIVVIADKPPAWKLHQLRFIPWNLATEISDLTGFDLGVMPLTEDPWAKGKCGFKALQYLALQIPAVASPVGVNSRIIQEGATGFLCSTPEEWLEKLRLLIEDATLRKKMGIEARKFIEQHYSVTSNSSTVLSLFP